MLKVLIFGATGMLGHVLLRELAGAGSYEVSGTARSARQLIHALPDTLIDKVTTEVDATDIETVQRVLSTQRPDVVVNAVGVIKQDPKISNGAHTVAINALFPHILAQECSHIGARLIHVSTDCVFSGRDGAYTEESQPDPADFYGLSKQLGEVPEPALVLRTSIIGHELSGHRSLLDWFLSSTGTVRGFTRAIYSGVTTTEFARLLATVILPRPGLAGLLHVAADPISKFELLKLVASEYDWPGDIEPEGGLVCDRSMQANKLADTTGYRPPDWPTMIRDMRLASRPWRTAYEGLVNA